jgi:hypothetical protein
MGITSKSLAKKIIFKTLINFCCIHLKNCEMTNMYNTLLKALRWYWKWSQGTMIWNCYNLVTSKQTNKYTYIHTYKQTPILINIHVFSAKIGHFSNILKKWLSIVWFCNVCLAMRKRCISWYIKATLGNDTYMSIVLHEGKG